MWVPTLNIAIGFAVDHEGNVGIYLSGGVGLGFGLGAFGGISFGTFPALEATIDDIEGMGIDVGGYLGAGAVATGELNMSLTNDDYRLGFTPLGFAGGAGIGGYVQGSYLYFIHKFNIAKLLSEGFEEFQDTDVYDILKEVFKLNDEQMKSLMETLYLEAVKEFDEKSTLERDRKDYQKSRKHLRTEGGIIYEENPVKTKK